jgi:hypothetical protein
MRFPASRHQSRFRDRGPSHSVATSQDLFGTAVDDPSHKIGALMSRKTRNLLLAAIVPIAVVFAGASLLWPSPPGATTQVPRPAQTAIAESPAPDPSAEPVVGRKTYAIPVPELAGLASSAVPGTRLELWVAWAPPLTKSPKIQRLLRDVILEKIVPPTVPEAPATAILSVSDRAVPDLLYGDKYGSLSVTMSP